MQKNAKKIIWFCRLFSGPSWMQMVLILAFPGQIQAHVVHCPEAISNAITSIRKT